MSTAVATATQARYTPEDLLTMPDGKGYELVDGRLLERKTGAESSLIGGELYLRLALFCKDRDMGKVWPADNGYQCFPHSPGLERLADGWRPTSWGGPGRGTEPPPTTRRRARPPCRSRLRPAILMQTQGALVRRPGVSFVKKGRLPGDVPPKGWIRIAPDMAAEVVSPNDNVGELEEKLDDYRKVRVPLVWVIYPDQRKARVYRPDGTAIELAEDDELDGEDVIPGFRCPLREILPRRQPAQEAPATPGAANGAGPS